MPPNNSSEVILMRPTPLMILPQHRPVRPAINQDIAASNEARVRADQELNDVPDVRGRADALECRHGDHFAELDFAFVALWFWVRGAQARGP